MNSHGADEDSRVDMFLAINHFNDLVKMGSIREVIRYIRDEYDVNLFDVNGLTAIHHAANIGNLRMIKLLIQHGANYTARSLNGNTVLMRAVMKGNLKIFEYIADLYESRNPPVPLDAMCHVNKDNQTLLSMACSSGFADMVRKLLREGFDPCQADNYGFTSLHHALPAYGSIGFALPTA